MEYVRTDWQTGERLFRCPAEGCHLRNTGTRATTHCNDEVRERPDTNLRVIGIISRASPEWAQLYAMRVGIERTFGSLKHSRALEGHRVRTMPKITLHATMSLLTYQATAKAHLKYRDMEHLRDMRVKVA